MIVGFTCSAFDLLHAGHIAMLREAKSQCDYLICGLQVDPSLDREEKNTLRKMKLSLDIKDKQIDLSDNHNLLNKLESQKNKLKENKEIEKIPKNSKTFYENFRKMMKNSKK